MKAPAVAAKWCAPSIWTPAATKTGTEPMGSFSSQDRAGNSQQLVIFHVVHHVSSFVHLISLSPAIPLDNS